MLAMYRLLHQWSEISKLLYSLTSRSLRYSLCSGPGTPISGGRVAWSLTGTHNSEHKPKHEWYIDCCFSYSKFTMFRRHDCSVDGFTSNTVLATARPEFQNRDLRDCAKCHFSLLISRAPAYSFANRVAKIKGVFINQPHLGLRFLCYEIITSYDCNEVRTVESWECLSHNKSSYAYLVVCLILIKVLESILTSADDLYDS
jgi:hypothetical protein